MNKIQSSAVAVARRSAGSRAVPLLLGLVLCGAYLAFGPGSAIAAELATTPAQEVVWTPELQLTVKAIGTPRLSPDGTSVVYTVADEVMTAEKSEYVSQIWLSSVDGSVTRQLTFGESTSINAKWSPDGATIVFTHQLTPGQNDAPTADIAMLDLAASATRPLAATELAETT